MAADKLVVMGKIAIPYGVQGWVKVQPFTETLAALLDYPKWWIGTQDNWHEYAVEECRVHANILVAKLAGCADRDLALALKGKQIAVPRNELPEPDENEYYWSDLIGLEVINLQQVDFGRIDDVFGTGANDVMVVHGERERLIPFTTQVIMEVSLSKKRILVDWDSDY